jgi:hypothetical protein
MKNKYITYILVSPDNKVFVDFTFDGVYTKDPQMISSITGMWTEYYKERLEDMITRYDRLKDFRVATIEITETFEFKEI